MMRDVAARKYVFDPRVYFVGCLLLIVATSIIHTVQGSLCLAVLSLVFLLVDKKTKHIPLYLISCIMVYSLVIGGGILQSAIPNHLAVVPLYIGTTGIKTIPILPFLIAIIKLDTGDVIESIMLMKLPKSVALGFATAFRFFPTFSFEFKSIRDAQKFRGILRPLSSLGSIYVPMLMRSVKISDEISMSMVARGVGIRNKIVRFKPLTFTKVDGIGIAVLAMSILVIYFATQM